jgi:hypothetical protein
MDARSFMTLDEAIDDVMGRSRTDSTRLAAIANYAKERLDELGLPGVRGGTGGELAIGGFARTKSWDVAFEFAGKERLLISLKSLWKNASGTVPNRIDDLMGETANVQQMSPEIVTGYILLFDVQADSFRREDGRLWSDFFEERVRRIAIRKAPLWNQGLLEGCWFVRMDSARAPGERLLNGEATIQEGDEFFRALLRELAVREPAIPFSKKDWAVPAIAPPPVEFPAPDSEESLDK